MKKMRHFEAGWRWALLFGGLALLVWQFFTFLDVVQAHTTQAQKVSQSAGWAGKPVGTMPQRTSTQAGSGAPLSLHAPVGRLPWMHTALP